MSKQKIADLPQEEQEKLISQMKDLGIGGVYATYTVEKALAAIEKKKAEKNPPETPAEPEGESGDGEQTDDEQTDDEQAEGDDAGDEQTTEENSDVPNSPETPEGSQDENDKEPEQEPEKPKKQNKEAKNEQRKSEGICHICRSKVYDGVCSGCGFSLRG